MLVVVVVSGVAGCGFGGGVYVLFGDLVLFGCVFDGVFHVGD